MRGSVWLCEGGRRFFAISSRLGLARANCAIHQLLFLVQMHHVALQRMHLLYDNPMLMFEAFKHYQFKSRDSETFMMCYAGQFLLVCLIR